MIHYHGTPIGGAKQDVARFLIGRHALVPFPSQSDTNIVAECCQSFVFDNGAYSVWKRGEILNVEGYTSWCDEWHKHPGFDWALIPDTIEGTTEDNDAMLIDWPKHIRGVPVYHLHESLERAEKLAHTYPIVALGSSGQWPSPGANGWWERINQVLTVMCDKLGRPLCRLHGLRMLNPKIFSKIPLASADSANVARHASDGPRWAKAVYAPASGWQRAAVLADRIEVHNSAAQWVYESETEQENLFA
jgi:hypothetical protein